MYIIFVITYEGFQTIEIEQIVLGFQKISCSSYYAAKFCMAQKEMCHLQHRALFRIDLRVAFFASTLTFTCLTSLNNSFPCIPPQWKTLFFGCVWEMKQTWLHCSCALDSLGFGQLSNNCYVKRIKTRPDGSISMGWRKVKPISYIGPLRIKHYKKIRTQ